MKKVYKNGMNVVIEGFNENPIFIPMRSARFTPEDTHFKISDDATSSRGWNIYWNELVNEDGNAYASTQEAINVLSSFVGSFSSAGQSGEIPAVVYNFTATNYSDLINNVAPVANDGQLARVFASQGVWPINRKLKGAYIYESGAWVYGNQELQNEIISNDNDISSLQSIKADKSVSFLAGLGLSGGGTLGGDRVFNVQLNKSLNIQDGKIELVGDILSPGNSFYYGTDINGVKTFQEKKIKDSFNFDANVSSTLYQDDFITLLWDSVNKQPFYRIPTATPLGAWGWHDINTMLILGNSTTFRRRSDDVSSGTGDFYFNDSGSQTAGFNMTNYGACGFFSVMKESFILGFPRYTMHLMVGNTGHGSVIIYKI